MGFWQENGSRKRMRLETSLQRGKKEIASNYILLHTSQEDWVVLPPPPSPFWVLASAWGKSWSGPGLLGGKAQPQA